jgi:hypothetical protein
LTHNHNVSEKWWCGVQPCLRVRESAAKDKVMAAHRKVMVANHPVGGCTS